MATADDSSPFATERSDRSGDYVTGVVARIRSSSGLEEDLGPIHLEAAPRWHPGLVALVKLGKETWELPLRDVACMHLGVHAGQRPSPGGRCPRAHGGAHDEAVLVLHGGAVLVLSSTGEREHEWDRARGRMLARFVGPWF